MITNKISLAFNALNLIYSVINGGEDLKFNNQDTFNSSIIDYKILTENLLKKDYISKSLHKTYSNFEEYDIELNILIQKHNEDLNELFKSFSFQIFEKDIIQFFSKKYKLIIFNKCPLSLVLDKFIISKFGIENLFEFILEDNLEFEVMKSPKWMIIMSTDLSVLEKYKDYGSWTVFLTFPYLNTSEHNIKISALIESNIEVLKRKNFSQHELFDLTSISFFNQEYFFDMIKEINETPLPVIEEAKEVKNKEMLFEEHILISKEYFKTLDPESVNLMRKSRKDKSSNSLAISDEANKQLFNKKIKELNCKKVLILVSVLIKPAAFNKSLFFISSEKIMYKFYYPKLKDHMILDTDDQLVGVRFNELQQVYYYKEIIENLSKLNKNKLTCKVENFIEVLNRRHFNKFLYEGFINFLKEKYFTQIKDSTTNTNTNNNTLISSNNSNSNKGLYNISSNSNNNNSINEKIIKEKLSLLKSVKKFCIKCEEFLNSNNFSKFEHKLSSEPFNYFFLIKFDSSNNIDVNHLMYLVVNKDGFTSLIVELKLLMSINKNDLDLIFEPYIPHDSYFIKANVLYGEPRIVIKKSFPMNIKIIIEEKFNGILKFNTGDIDNLFEKLKNESDIEPSKINPQQKMYDEQLVKVLIADFIEFSKLTFVGFDFIVTKNFNHYIIDCNYFPSYSERGSSVGEEIRKHFEYIYLLNNKKMLV